MKTIKNNLCLKFLIVFIFFFSNNSFSQNIDSLLLKLTSIKSDTNKIFLLNKISSYYINHGTPNQSLPYIDEQFILSENLNFKKGKYYCQINYGNVYNTLGELDKGMNYFLNALEILKSGVNSKDYINMATIYANMGNTYGLKEKLAPALEYYIKALNILEKIKSDNLSFKNNILKNMAIIYEKNGQFQKSVEYNFTALTYFKSKHDTLNIAGVYPNLGNTYYAMKNYNKALDAFNKGLYYAKKANRLSSLSSIHTGIGRVYQDLEKFDLALKHHLESYRIAKENDLKAYMGSSLSNIGVDYHGLKEYDKALKYLNESQVIAKEIGGLYLIKMNYKCIAEVYESLNMDSKALELYKKQNQTNDSIFNDKNATQINELSVKFETAKKEKEIIVLNANLLSKKKDEIILQAKIQKRNAIIFGTIIGSILLIITIILLYTRRRLLLKNLHQLEINQQRDNTTASIVQAQEKEQTRIAKDLHDSIGTFLSTLKINLQLYEDAIPVDKSEGYQNALNLIDKISVELRNIMKNLASETLQDYGLIKGYEELVQRINELEIIKVDFHTNGLTDRLDEVTEHNLYRIAQELLNNCIKHSKAEHATIQLIVNDDTITLMFEDNGVGFDVDSPLLKNKNHGMGLKNIYNRVEFIKGTIHIESSAENGSSFIIEVPKK